MERNISFWRQYGNYTHYFGGLTPVGYYNGSTYGYFINFKSGQKYDDYIAVCRDSYTRSSFPRSSQRLMIFSGPRGRMFMRGFRCVREAD
jgi:hypothetical protein